MPLNPVAWKDLLTYARGLQQGGGGLRFVSSTLLLGLPLLIYAWCVVAVPGPWAQGAPVVFMVVAGLMALFGLSVAVPAATAFALERDRETLESLVVSPLSPWRLVLGKLTAAVTIGAITHAVMLPLLAIAYVLGGGDLLFVPQWLTLLLATNVSFASFCLVVGARRLDSPSKLGWMRAQSTQAQMALQGTLGLGVLVSLGPIYATLLLPLAAAQGVPLGPLLDTLAPVGALHPLVALVVWGDADVLGARVPVWLIGVIVHGLAALPLLSDAVEAQRSEGTPPGRTTRLLALPFLAALLVLAGATAAGLAPTARALVATLTPAVLLLATAARTGFVPASSAPRVRRRGLLTSLRPDLALESAPDRAPGFVLLLAVLCAPLVVWGAGPFAGAWTLAALALTSVSMAAIGARLVARGQEREDRALEAAVTGSGPTPAPAPEGPEVEEVKPPRGRFFLRLALASLLLPPLGAAGLAAGRGAVPTLEPLAPAFQAFVALGLAANPFAALLPLLADVQALGSDVPRQLLAGVGVDPWLVFGLHLGLYGLALVISVLTVRAPLDTEAVIRHGLSSGPAKPPAVDGIMSP